MSGIPTVEFYYELAEKVWARFATRWREAEREDAIQQAVIRCWMQQHRYDPERTQPQTFFSTVIRNEIGQHVRVARNRRLLGCDPGSNRVALGLARSRFGGRVSHSGTLQV